MNGQKQMTSEECEQVLAENEEFESKMRQFESQKKANSPREQGQEEGAADASAQDDDASDDSAQEFKEAPEGSEPGEETLNDDLERALHYFLAKARPGTGTSSDWLEHEVEEKADTWLQRLLEIRLQVCDCNREASLDGGSLLCFS